MAIEQDQRQAFGQIGLQGVGVDLGGHDDQAIDPAAHDLQDFCQFLAGGVRAGNQQMEAMLLRDLIRAANDFGEKLAVQIGKDKADGIGSFGAEAAAHGIGGVVQGLRDFFYAAPCFFVHRPDIIEDARNGSGRDARFFGNFFDRHAHRAEGSICVLDY